VPPSLDPNSRQGYADLRRAVKKKAKNKILSSPGTKGYLPRCHPVKIFTRLPKLPGLESHLTRYGLNL